jgi:hypothetical protein
LALPGVRCKRRLEPFWMPLCSFMSSAGLGNRLVTRPLLLIAHLLQRHRDPRLMFRRRHTA